MNVIQAMTLWTRFMKWLAVIPLWVGLHGRAAEEKKELTMPESCRVEYELTERYGKDGNHRPALFYALLITVRNHGARLAAVPLEWFESWQNDWMEFWKDGKEMGTGPGLISYRGQVERPGKRIIKGMALLGPGESRRYVVHFPGNSMFEIQRCAGTLEGQVELRHFAIPEVNLQLRAGPNGRLEWLNPQPNHGKTVLGLPKPIQGEKIAVGKNGKPVTVSFDVGEVWTRTGPSDNLIATVRNDTDQPVAIPMAWVQWHDNRHVEYWRGGKNERVKIEEASEAASQDFPGEIEIGARSSKTFAMPLSKAKALEAAIRRGDFDGGMVIQHSKMPGSGRVKVDRSGAIRPWVSTEP
jgi:hypothetical protein